MKQNKIFITALIISILLNVLLAGLFILNKKNDIKTDEDEFISFAIKYASKIELAYNTDQMSKEELVEAYAKDIAYCDIAVDVLETENNNSISKDLSEGLTYTKQYLSQALSQNKIYDKNTLSNLEKMSESLGKALYKKTDYSDYYKEYKDLVLHICEADS
ncbi:MAG: hypothetical protein K6G65_05675 [Lachnospiraceae bacterium]|nr:hypothetical protein [Lachnospiraceae bacterium]